MAYNDTNRVPREYYPKGGKVIAFEVLAAKKILKGDLVRISAAGYAYSGDGATSLTTDDMFVGVALETVDNSYTGATSGGQKVRCLTEGIVPFAEASVNITDVGTWAIQSTANAYTITSDATNFCISASGAVTNANNVHIGYICGKDRVETTVPGSDSTTKLKVFLQPLMQIYGR